MSNEEILAKIKADELFKSIMDNAPLLISAKDLEGNVIMANRRFELLEGYDAASFVGRNVYDLFPRDIAEKLWSNDLAALNSRQQVTVEETVQHKDGSNHTYHTVKFPLYDQQGEPCAVCAVSYDISDVKHAEQISHQDDLTSLYNRRFFNKTFTLEMNRVKRSTSTLRLMLLDLDHFKDYNDSFGHEEGDRALVLIGDTIAKTCHRASDFCFRIGGEEFTIICTVDHPDNVYELAEKLRREIEALAIKHPQNQPYGVMTCSIGVATCVPSQAEPTQSQLYSLADKAMYEAKRAGRNTAKTESFP
ncbi:MAG: sensor domain-containing diguanylate cyclase [Ketobacteraceae bacterium]|nr:sensor domain-containing diguanylate cyclase [Ketobacteraceae bacterium]